MICRFGSVRFGSFRCQLHARMGTLQGMALPGSDETAAVADRDTMFETTTPAARKSPQDNFAAFRENSRRLPLELETEFSEMQASAPAANVLPALLGACLFFHALLIAERASSMLTPRMFAVRGIPLTLVLLSFLLVPAPYRTRRVGRAFLVSFSVLLVAALLAGVPFRGAGELLPAQTGVALLLLLAGWLAALPRGWALTMAAGTMLADGTSLLLGTAVRAVGWAVLLESFWAPLFSAALVVLLANMRRQEERRDFMLLRQAAFAGVPGGASTEQSRHLDPQTGAANRLAFEMRFRAAWDQAAGRRHSIALLFFSIDGLSEQRRDLGLSFTELVQAQVAGLLKDGLRRSDDMVARFDQQHFVVMLPGVGTDGATQIAERLRGSVEEMGVYAGQKRHSATVTVGAASLRAKRGIPREKLVDCAVGALEQARAAGSNLVCVEGRGCIPRMS